MSICATLFTLFSLFSICPDIAEASSEFLNKPLSEIEKKGFKFISSSSIGYAESEGRSPFMMVRGLKSSKDLIFLHKWNEKTQQNLVSDVLLTPKLRNGESIEGVTQCHFDGKPTIIRSNTPVGEWVPLAIHNSLVDHSVVARRAWVVDLKTGKFKETQMKVICENEDMD